MGNTDTQKASLALRSYSGQVELHDHDYHQIVLPQSGSMEIEVDGRGGKVDWSQGVIIPAGAPHAFSANTTNTFLVLDVPLPSASTHNTEAETIKRLNEKSFFPVRPEIRHLLDYATRSAPLLTSSPEVAQSWSTLLMSSLVQPHSNTPDHGQFTLARALTHIENNLDSHLTASEIARISGTSERRLYILFEQHLRTTPFAHVTRLRLNLAMDLLRDTQLSITDIAHRVGYADQSALNHALKKSHDLTPASARRCSRAY
ncbi:helix-turn-helix domain-containing protein [Pseudomonas sp. Fl5BN2]|uniref:helix-turn-helix domain-containing protein n=1 Tax=unclassified Pseudomonas TaxID=196821 RepID=UPI001377D2A9|nr:MULTISPECIES: AraC family transcriptional regulator [unclassified Pseudomonas]NBF06749.1 helix-turn-helix domain-containing protein [Pseudomonas sp. Fl5BN2]NBF11794.1 helix-turn-helix domain-containing protein [Pseudomonas sp. Fl4BN1]